MARPASILLPIDRGEIRSTMTNRQMPVGPQHRRRTNIGRNTQPATRAEFSRSILLPRYRGRAGLLHRRCRFHRQRADRHHAAYGPPARQGRGAARCGEPSTPAIPACATRWRSIVTEGDKVAANIRAFFRKRGNDRIVQFDIAVFYTFRERPHRADPRDHRHLRSGSAGAGTRRRRGSGQDQDQDNDLDVKPARRREPQMCVHLRCELHSCFHARNDDALNLAAPCRDQPRGLRPPTQRNHIHENCVACPARSGAGSAGRRRTWHRRRAGLGRTLQNHQL